MNDLDLGARLRQLAQEEDDLALDLPRNAASIKKAVMHSHAELLRSFAVTMENDHD